MNRRLLSLLISLSLLVLFSFLSPSPPAQGQHTSVTVGARTADGNWNLQSTFAPGDPIQWVIEVENTTRDLFYNTDYHWKVVATDNHNASSTSSIWHFKTSAAPPSPSTLVSPINDSTTSDNTPTFDWNNASNSTEYQLQVDNNANFSSAEINITTANSDYTPALGLSDDAYFWQVRGHNRSGSCDVYGSWSSVWSVTINTIIPPSVNLSNSPGTSENPDVAIGSGGDVHVVWSDNTFGSYDIFYTSKALGDAWSAPINMSNQTGNAKHPSLVVDNAGTVHLAWTNESDVNIYYIKKPAGSGWATPEPVDVGFKPRLATGSNLSIHLVSEIGGEIYYRVKPNGGNWSTPVNLSNTIANSFDPDIALDSQNRPHVVWDEDLSGNGEIYYVTQLDSGSWSSPENVSNNSITSHFAKIIIDSTNRVHVFWPNHDAEGISRMMYSSKPASGSWSMPVTLFANHTSYHPTPAVGADDVLRVVWTSWIDTFYSKQIDGTWLTPLNISNNPTIGWVTALDSKSGIDALVWMDEEPGNLDIYYTEVADSAALKVTNLTLTDGPLNSYPPLTQPETTYELKGDSLWFDLTNDGQIPFSPPPEGGHYTIQVLLKQGDGQVVREYQLSDESTQTLDELPLLEPGKRKSLRIENLAFFDEVENGKLEVIFKPDSSLNLKDSSLEKTITVGDHPDSFCACIAEIAQAIIKFVAAHADAGVLSRRLADLGFGLIKEGCKQDIRGALKEIATWDASVLLESFGGDVGKVASVGVGAASELGSNDIPCLILLDWLLAWTYEMIRQGYPANLIMSESPVYPLVINTSGQRTGFLENGQIIEEIPESRAVVIGEKRIIMYPGQDTVNVEVVGYAPGTMNLHTVFYQPDATGITFSYENVQVTQGMKAMLTSTDDSHLLKIDADGDGTVDQSHSPDKIEYGFPTDYLYLPLVAK